MNSESIVKMFGLTGNQKLYVTLARPSGEVWAKGVACTVKNPTYPDDKLPTVGITPDGNAGYSTDFPVESIESTEDGQPILLGPKGSATFRVISND